MENFVDCIKERDSILKQYAREIVSSGREVVLYGSGCWAEQQYRMLQECGVEIREIAVDEKYLKIGQKSFTGGELISLESVQKKEQKILWIGFNLDKDSFEQTKTRIEGDYKFYQIYACDCAKFESFEAHNWSFYSIEQDGRKFQWLYEKLYDEKSREVFLSYISQRISGNYKYGESLYDEPHYFSPDIIHLKDEVFVDCGAFTGDTILELLSLCSPRKVIAFEPEKNNFSKLKKQFENDARIFCVKKGAYDKKTVLKFTSDCADASKVSENGTTSIETETIDDVCRNDVVTFIKMDIEGSELAALHGAKETIRRSHPILAISAYHKYEDLFTLPQYIYSLDASYKFYLRRHSHLVHELVLYAL